MYLGFIWNERRKKKIYLLTAEVDGHWQVAAAYKTMDKAQKGLEEAVSNNARRKDIYYSLEEVEIQ